MKPIKEKRILIIDEDLKSAGETCVFLTKAGYAARYVSDYAAVIASLQEWRPDILLLDVFTHAFNAMDFLKRLKENPYTADQKVLILSHPKHMDLVTGPAQKVVGCLIKPVDFESLGMLLRKFAGEASSAKRIPVLVADDDPEFSDLLKMFLETNYYRPIMVSNGDAALKAIQLERPAAVLLDMMMPGKNGFEVLDELDRDQSLPKIPIVALTAVHPNSFQDPGLLTGMPEIISKHVSKEFLLQAIDRIFSGEYAAAAGIEAKTVKPKILMADDKPELLSLMQEVLEDAGFEVYPAANGQEAVDLVRLKNPDIVILDYEMPVKTGLAAAEEIKADPLFAHLPIVMLTGIADKQTKIMGLNMGVDDYLIKPIDTDELLARIRMLLKRNKQVLDTNPLTKLPGNPSIQSRIETEIAKNKEFAVLYIDINQFKSYNDAYGFDAGDKIIKTTASLLVQTTRQGTTFSDFIGHIGGDDFIIITSVERSEGLCKKILGSFDSIAPSFYSEEDRSRGYMVSTDRMGNFTKFPFLSLSIGVVHNINRKLTSLGQISQIGAELKKHAKTFQKSYYVVDRRKF